MGTRPEAIKLIPVYLQALKSHVYQPIIITTGQHIEMLQQVLDYFDIHPEFSLKVTNPNNNLSLLTSILFQSIESVIEKTDPDLIMVQGDTISAWVAAMVGFYHKIVVVHVEAGLRTGDKYNPFPEEIYRKQITQLADIHFTPTTVATKNLVNEGVSNIYQVGNTVVDNLYYCLRRTKANSSKYELRISAYTNKTSKIVLITCHRRENFKNMKGIAEAVMRLAKTYPDLLFIIPLHMNPIVQKELGSNLQVSENIFLIDPIPYDEFIYLLSKSYLVLTDSGGIQEEAASCNVPFIILRDVTERNEAVTAGCGLIAGTNVHIILETFNKVHLDPNKYSEMQNAENPFGDGKSSERIISILEQSFFS